MIHLQDITTLAMRLDFEPVAASERVKQRRREGGEKKNAAAVDISVYSSLARNAEDFSLL